MYLVTGSFSGIGKSIYNILKQTDKVIGIDIMPSDMICDLSLKENIDKLVLDISNLNKNIDGIITSAGVIGGDDIISINYFGSVRIVESLYKHYGTINAVLIGSILYSHHKINEDLISLLLDNKEEEAILFAKNNKLTDTEIYACCKLALKRWVRQFIDINPNTRINIIHPSLTKTGMTEKYLESHVIKIIFHEDIKKAPVLEPEDISDFVCYLIKNSKAINGQSIFVDNGAYEH